MVIFGINPIIDAGYVERQHAESRNVTPDLQLCVPWVLHRNTLSRLQRSWSSFATREPLETVEMVVEFSHSAHFAEFEDHV